jgi:hypothetical protein
MLPPPPGPPLSPPSRVTAKCCAPTSSLHPMNTGRPTEPAAPQKTSTGPPHPRRRLQLRGLCHVMFRYQQNSNRPETLWCISNPFCPRTPAIRDSTASSSSWLLETHHVFWVAQRAPLPAMAMLRVGLQHHFVHG